MIINNDDLPVYNIGVVAGLIGVHPETLRIWERNQLINPSRRNKQRLYSNNDLKRLKFIHTLINQRGLNVAGVKEMLNLYPCWGQKNCPGGTKKVPSANSVQSKPCWKDEGSFCPKHKDNKCLECPLYPNNCACPK